jgi:hypothetical protein
VNARGWRKYARTCNEVKPKDRIISIHSSGNPQSHFGDRIKDTEVALTASTGPAGKQREGTSPFGRDNVGTWASTKLIKWSWAVAGEKMTKLKTAGLREDVWCLYVLP